MALQSSTVQADQAKPTDPRTDESFLIRFSTPFDHENPKDWPVARKWIITTVLSATGFNRVLVSTIIAPALSTISQELDMTSTESFMSLSVYLLATAFGPLVMGPLSEIYGRKPVLHASNIWFLVWNLICGFSNSKQMLIASRFLAGFGASAIFALANGVLADTWRPEQRGRSLGIYVIIPMLGAAVGMYLDTVLKPYCVKKYLLMIHCQLGPIIGGFIAARTTWRWMFWSTSGFQALATLISMIAFRETYEPKILNARANKKRQETGDNRYHTATGHANATKKWILGRALIRPIHLLACHPIIQVSSIIAAFYYGVLYIVLSTFSDMWTKQYGMSVEISGLHYIAVALGEVTGSQICAKLMDKLYHVLKGRYTLKNRGPDHSQECNSGTGHTPESRMPCIIPGALFGPLGLFMYGWAAQYQLHWIVVDIGIFIAMLSMPITSMTMQAYIMEAYPEHTSSAGAAQQFLKSLTAFLFPLFAPALYATLGYGWGNSTIAFIGLLFGLPAPLIIWMYGARLRMRSRKVF